MKLILKLMGNKNEEKDFRFFNFITFSYFQLFSISADEEEVDAVVVTGSYIKTDREEIDYSCRCF